MIYKEIYYPCGKNQEADEYYRNIIIQKKRARGGNSGRVKFILILRDAAYSSSSESSWNLLMMSFMTFGGTVS